MDEGQRTELSKKKMRNQYPITNIQYPKREDQYPITNLQYPISNVKKGAFSSSSYLKFGYWVLDIGYSSFSYLIFGYWVLDILLLYT
jgi:hypothetical protein